MKMRLFTVTFERTLTVTVLAPEDTTTEEIETLAALEEVETAWDPGAWEANVDSAEGIEVPDAECIAGPPNKYGYRNPADGAVARADAVLADDRQGLVNPMDATWWVTGRTPAPVFPIAHGGQHWAVSGSIIVRADVIPEGFEDNWVSELSGDLGGFLNPQSVPATDDFDPKYAPVLALGTVCRDRGTHASVMLDGKVLAVVGPYRGGGLRVVDGRVS